MTFLYRKYHRLIFQNFFIGIPTYFVASLLEMSELGGTDAESLKEAMDNIFSEKGSLPVKEYNLKLVSVTADGASVNTGKLSGLMTRFASTRIWLVRIHCINSRIELAVKDAFTGISKLNDIGDFYQSNFNLLKNSGKIKDEIGAAAKVLGIQHYELPKLTGTRFVGHRRSAFKALLNDWPLFLVAYENVASDPKTKSETKAKVLGLLKKFQSYNFLIQTCIYLDL